jgi:DNA-binding CsgD family transcriptional regulator
MLEPRHLPSDGRLASAILDHMRLPAFLVEDAARLKYSNAAGIAALKEGGCFKDAGETLSAVHPNDNARLRAAISGACTGGERRTFLMQDARNPRPSLVTAIPFLDDEPAAGKEAIVFVQPCETVDDVFASTLRQLFRLSAAETAIAAALVAGADIESIAEMRNAKVTTVRTQIAAMLLKTRTRRQGELIALFSRICSLP